MANQTFIKQGRAVLTQNGLRCQFPREKDPTTPCNKLLVKKNALGQVAGAFKCERCGQEIVVELAVKP
jgi:hypothetical protein